MKIVLDKSYLHGSTQAEIHRMCLRHQTIMPEVLLLEILTTDSQEMIECFKKFPKIENPVALIPRVGSLIRAEVEKRSPCYPIDAHFLNIRFIFNEQLAKNKFIFSEQQKKSLEEWNSSTRECTKSFIEKATTTDGWLPELREYKPGKDANIIKKAMHTVANDDDFIRKIYGQLRDEIYEFVKELWPEPSEIGRNWVLFRYLQTHLLSAIEHIRKYGLQTPSVITKHLQNEFLDIDYCIIGSLADGLATRDKIISKFYKLLCPDNILLK